MTNMNPESQYFLETHTERNLPTIEYGKALAEALCLKLLGKTPEQAVAELKLTQESTESKFKEVLDEFLKQEKDQPS
jgi:hypothetical protein